MKIVYGTDTGSVEEAAQCVIVDVPDDLEDIQDIEEFCELAATDSPSVFDGVQVAEFLLAIISENGWYDRRISPAAAEVADLRDGTNV